MGQYLIVLPYDLYNKEVCILKLIKLGFKDFKKKVNEFYNKSMFTFEGMDYDDEEGLKVLEQHLRQYGFEGKEIVLYCFTGDIMDEYFELTESNAYPKDLKFIVIPEFYNPQYKISIGARWFDDIVSNNRIRQNAINNKLPADYGEEDEEE